MITNTGKGLSHFMQRQFSRSLQTTKVATERITTGKRVNRAADDVGAFHMASNINSEQVSRKMAIRNIESGLDLIERADSGMTELTNILSRLRELAVYGSTSTLSDSDRDVLNKDFQETMTAFDTIAKEVNYDDTRLLVSFNVDLGLLVDVSGSMYQEISVVKSSIANVVDKVRGANIDLKIGLAWLGADNQDNVRKRSDFTDTDAHLDFEINNLNTSHANAGMDPWSSLVNLSSSENDVSGQYDPDAFTWRDGTESKEIVVFTDTGRETFTSGYTEQSVIDTMIEEDIKVHAIGGSQGDGNIRRDARESLGNITAQTGGTFTFTDQVATQVQEGLDNIADNLIENYGGSSEIRIQADINNSTEHQQSIDIPFDFTAAALGIDALDISTQENAQSAISKLAETLNTLLEGRSKAGALHNKLLHMHGAASINSSEQETALYKIQDADLANETAKMTSENIKSQVGLASMSQARQLSLSSMKSLMTS